MIPGIIGCIGPTSDIFNLATRDGLSPRKFRLYFHSLRFAVLFIPLVLLLSLFAIRAAVNPVCQDSRCRGREHSPDGQTLWIGRQ